MMHDGSEDRLIKMPDAAKMLGVHPRTVRRRIAEGVLKGFCKVGRCARISYLSVCDYRQSLIKASRIELKV